MLVPEIVPPVDPVYVNVYVLIVNCAMNVLFPVVGQSILVIHVIQSDHPLNVYPVFATACTSVPVKL